MEERIITDTDFVPKEHYIVDSFHELYEIEYELLYMKPDFNRMHDNIINHVHSIPAQLTRKAKLTLWRKELERSCKQLKAFINKKYHTCVFIPVTSYYERIETTIQQYEIALIIIDELIKAPEQVETIKIYNNVDIPDIYTMFHDYFVCYEGYNEADNKYYKKIIIDEMLRRGLTSYGKLIEVRFGDTTWLKNNFKPSELFDDRHSFLNAFLVREKKFMDKDETENPIPVHTEEQLREEDNMKVKCGVMYQILKNKLDDYSMAAIINYSCRVPYNNKVHKGNKNSIEKYLRLYKKHETNPETFFSEDLKPHIFDDINAILKEYDLQSNNDMQ